MKLKAPQPKHRRMISTKARTRPARFGVHPVSNQDRVVRKPVNANPGLNVNRSVNFFLDKNVFDRLSFA